MQTLRTIVFSLLFIVIQNAHADVGPPQPPAENPHPPVTDADKKRVAFADLAIEQLLKTPIVNKTQNFSLGNDQSIKLDMDEACLKSTECIQKNAIIVNYIDSFKSQHSPIAEYRFTHIIPWSFQKFVNRTTSTKSEQAPKKNKSAVSMPTPVVLEDEYMLHSYVRPTSSSGWYHLDIIVTEDKDGNLKLRRFFIIPIPSDDSKLPPGVKC